MCLVPEIKARQTTYGRDRMYIVNRANRHTPASTSTSTSTLIHPETSAPSQLLPPSHMRSAWPKSPLPPPRFLFCSKFPFCNSCWPADLIFGEGGCSLPPPGLSPLESWVARCTVVCVLVGANAALKMIGDSAAGGWKCRFWVCEWLGRWAWGDPGGWSFQIDLWVCPGAMAGAGSSAGSANCTSGE